MLLSENICRVIMDYIPINTCEDALSWEIWFDMFPTLKDNKIRFRKCYKDHPLINCCFTHDDIPLNYTWRLSNMFEGHHICFGPAHTEFGHFCHKGSPSGRLRMFREWIAKHARDPSILNRYITCCKGYGMTHMDDHESFFYYPSEDPPVRWFQQNPYD